MPIIKKQNITSVGKDAENWKPCALLVGYKVVHAATVENSMSVTQKVKQLPYGSAIPLLGI